MNTNRQHEDDFDRILAESMRARPLPRLADDLAERAIDLAQRQTLAEAELHLLRLTRIRRWKWVANVAAMVVVACLAAWLLRDVSISDVIARWMPESTEVQATGEMNGELAAETETADVENTVAVEDLLFIGGGVLLAALALLAVDRAFAQPGGPILWPPSQLLSSPS